MAFDNKSIIVNGRGNKVIIGDKKKVTISIGAFVIVVAIFVFGLQGILRNDDSEKIIGVWDSDNGYVMEFMTNGTVRQGSGNGWDKEGKYELSENGLLIIKDEFGFDDAYFDMKFTGNNKLTLSEHNDTEWSVELKKRE